MHVQKVQNVQKVRNVGQYMLIFSKINFSQKILQNVPLAPFVRFVHFKRA